MANTSYNSKAKPNIAEVVFITWIIGLLRLGTKRPLTEDDLHPLTDEDTTEHIVNKLQREWQKELIHSQRYGQTPRLYEALIRSTWSMHLLQLILKCVDNICIISMSILLSFLLKELSKNSDMSIKTAGLLVAGISACSFLKPFVNNQGRLAGDMVDLKWKAGLTGLMYRKVLSLSRGSLADVTTGKIMNLISNDVQRLDELNFAAVQSLYAPWKIVVSIIILISLVGWQCLAGVLFVFLATIYNMLAAKAYGSLRARAVFFTDKRLGAINDVIRGVRAVKMYAWEWNFQSLIKKFRRNEVKLMRLKSILVSTFATLYSTTSSVASFMSIITFVFTRETALSPSEIFTLVSFMKVIEFATAGELGECVTHIFDAKVTADRIQNFLIGVCDDINNEHEEKNNFIMCKMIPRRVISRVKSLKRVAKIMRIQSFKTNAPVLYSLKASGALDTPKGSDELGKVKMCNVSAGWHSESRALQGFSLEATSGQLVIITGPVGSGKSTLLMTIQGELPIMSGTIERGGKIAYVSQASWVFSDTVRENITFGREFDQSAYDVAVRVCALQEDFERFPKGDLSVVGQRGVRLSGGQRARLSLARAVYSDADIYLLDDPLSAVDANVGVRLFRECICGALAEKTRILVTHQLQYLQHADYVVMLKDGKAEHSGTPDDVRSKILLDEKINVEHQGATEEHGNSNNYHGNTCPHVMDTGMSDMAEEDEDRAIGSVKLHLYWAYFRAGLPPALLVGLFILLIVMEASILTPYWWLIRLSEMSHEDQKSSLTLGIYGAVVGWAISFTTCVLCLLLYASLRSSERLHNQMTIAVLRSPILFFDTNPLGRIMNRFSKDVGSMDEAIPIKFVLALTLILEFMGRLILTALVEYRLAIAVVPVIAVFLLLSWFYLKSSRELQRIESVKYSPIYAHFTDTLAGLEIIKVAKMKNRFLETFMRHQDERIMATILVRTAKNWMALYVDLLCSVFVTAVAFSSLIIRDPALTGMILTLAIALIGDTSFGVTKAAEVENEMTSVERVLTYTKLPSEPGYSRTALPRENWPEQGALCFRGMSLTYRQGNPRVLHGLNVDIPAKQRIGIAGRTGAGKSSLVAALFRLPEPDGQVLIDGIDLGTIDIQSARRAIAVIAQDPVLFGRTLKKNLDPFQQFSDQEIWASLGEVQLLETIEKLPGQLNFQLGEAGTSFSVGERQLLCLTRALLQKSKVLVLDEATANVDYKTDLLVQQVLRNKFPDCTLLTIAHRLNTIMDYDKVLVMDKGRIVEFDKPDELVRKKDGVFARLARNSNLLKP